MTDQLTSFDDLYKPQAATAALPAADADSGGGLPSFDEQYKPAAAPDRALTPFEQRFYNTADTGGGGGAPIAAADSGVDWADVGKGAAGGLGRGVTGLVGLPGSVGGLVHSGLSYLGVPEPALAAAAKVASYAPMVSAFTGPDTAAVQQAIENYTGKFYEPKTLAGKYASTIAEFAPAAMLPVGEGGIAAKTLNTVMGGIGSETAGQLTKDTPYEAPARFIGGLAGVPGGAKLITPSVPATAQRAADVAALRAAEVPMTAGQITGSRPLQWMESAAADMPFSGPAAQRLFDRTATGYDQALTNSIFDRNALTQRGIPPEAALPQPDVAAAGRGSLQDEYNRTILPNTLRADPQLMHDQQAVLTAYERGTLPSQRAGGSRDLAEIHNDILDHLVANQGGMAGDVYQQMRSRLGTQARAAQVNNPYLATALRDTRGALDRAMARSLPPDDAAALADTNRRYALMKQTESAVARAGDHLSPAGVAQAVRAGRASQYMTNAGDLDPLVRAAANVLKPLPNSGTAARTAAQQLYNLPQMLHAAAASGAGGTLGALFGLPGIVAGIVAPHAAARMVVSRPGQAYLSNQLLPQRGRDVLTQALLQQQLSLPQAIGQNQANRAQYQRDRAEQLRRAGMQ